VENGAFAGNDQMLYFQQCFRSHYFISPRSVSFLSNTLIVDESKKLFFNSFVANVAK